ncbi:hypothetical protein [Actinophytocola sp.]|uniref:hypothetical protein n=1 Tax=Actinophytocola sp. TaxID=1872138 RepID=UPI003899D83E
MVVLVVGVAAVALAAVVWVLMPGQDPVGPSGTPAAAGSTAENPGGSAGSGYGVAIRKLAEQVNGPGKVPVVYVLERTCPDVMTEPPVDTDCDKPIPAAVRDDLTAALRSFSRVEFVRTAAEVTGPDLETVNGGVLTMLGQARFSGGTAEVPLAVRKGGLNSRGMTYRLSYRDGQWQITGNMDSGWIS